VPVALLERFHGGFAVDHGRDDLAVLGVLLLADDHPVPVRDGRVDHRVAGDLQHEQAALADKLPGKREDVLNLLIGGDRDASRDPADERHVGGLLRCDVHAVGGQFAFGAAAVGALLGADSGVTGQPNLHRARAAHITVQVTLALQRRELVRDTRRAGQADRLADLPHRRRVSALLHRIPDDLQDLALPPGQDVVRVWLVGRLRDHDGSAALGLAARPALRADWYVRDFGSAVTCGVVHRMNLRLLVVAYGYEPSVNLLYHQTSVRRVARLRYAGHTKMIVVRSIELNLDRTHVPSNWGLMKWVDMMTMTAKRVMGDRGRHATGRRLRESSNASRQVCLARLRDRRLGSGREARAGPRDRDVGRGRRHADGGDVLVPARVFGFDGRLRLPRDAGLDYG
jgi:hypothetical protein